MILGDMGSYMSTIDYVSEAYKKDALYANYVERSLAFTTNQLNLLNKELEEKGRSSFCAEIRVKNSDVINSEVNAFAFYINSGVFSKCYNMDLRKYKNAFQSEYIKGVLHTNPIELPFQFIVFHEINHIRRAHAEVDNKLVSKDLYVKSTEMDADLIAVAMLYRGLQNLCRGKHVDDAEVRCLAIISVIEVLCSMKQYSGGKTYQTEGERLSDIVLKMFHLNEDPTLGMPVDVNCSSGATKKNSIYIREFMLRIKNLWSQEQPAVELINDLFTYILSGKYSGTISAWNEIKHEIGETSKTTV